MWFEWDKRGGGGGGGRRWWKQWPKSKSYDVNAAQDGNIWEGDMRRYTNDPFDGYFREIQEIAIRAIPPGSPGDVPKSKDLALAMTPRTARTVEKVTKYLNQTESFEPQLDSPKTIESFLFSSPERKQTLLSLKSEEDYGAPKKSKGCSKVEKFLMGTSVYLAVAVLIVLIIIAVMVASLKDINTSIQNINVDDESGGALTSVTPGQQIQITLTTITVPQPSRIVHTTAFPTIKTSSLLPTIISRTTKTPTTTSKTTKKPTTLQITSSTTLLSTTTTNTPSTTKAPKTTTSPLLTSKTTIFTTPTKISTIKSSTTIFSTTSTTTSTTTSVTSTSTTSPTTTSTTTSPTTTPTTTSPTTTPTTTSTTTTPPTTTSATTTTTISPTTFTTTSPTTTPTTTSTTIPTTTSPTTTTTTTASPTTSTTISSTTSSTMTSPKTSTTISPTTSPTMTSPTTSTVISSTTSPTTASPTTSTTISSTTSPTTASPTTSTTISSTTSLTTTSPPTSTTPSPTTSTTISSTTTPTTTSPTTSTTISLATSPTTTITTTTKVTTEILITDPVTTEQITTTQDDLCETSYCNGLAYNMMGYMNISVDECTDFYEYACGNWISSRRQLINDGLIDSWQRSIEDDERTHLNLIFKELLEQPAADEDPLYTKNLKQMYTSCLNYDSVLDDAKVLQEIRLLLDQLSFDDSLTTQSPIEDLQRLAMTEFGSFPLFRQDVTSRENGDVQTYILKISPPTLFLRRSAYDFALDETIDGLDYLNTVPRILDSIFGSSQEGGGNFRRRREVNDIKEYDFPDPESEKIMFQRRKLLQYDYYDYEGGQGQVYNTARLKIIEVFELERKLHQIIPRPDIRETNIIIPFGELQFRYPNINWTTVFPSFDFETQVMISNPSYFEGLNTIIAENDADIIKFHELVTTILQGVWKFLPYQKRRELDYFKDVPAMEHNWVQCVNYTFTLLNSELHQELASKRSSDISLNLNNIKSTLKNVSDIMRVNIKNSTYLSSNTKVSLQDILSSLVVSSSPPPSLDDSFVLPPFSSFLLCATNSLKKKNRNDLSKIGTDRRDPEWFDIRMRYNKRLNVIEVPLGLSVRKQNMDPIFPFLSTVGNDVASSVIEALYGSMVTPLTEFWWSTESSSSQYQDTWKCFDDQIAASTNENSRPSTGSVMIADGALHLVYKVFESLLLSDVTKPYTLPSVPASPNQVVLLHFTQNFCELPYDNVTPKTKERINIVLRNSEFFHESFQCPSDTLMNSDQNCSLLK